jgi:hypothetical protein
MVLDRSWENSLLEDSRLRHVMNQLPLRTCHAVAHRHTAVNPNKTKTKRWGGVGWVAQKMKDSSLLWTCNTEELTAKAEGSVI